MAAETNQFTPALYRGTEAVPTLKEGVLDKALADDAIAWLHGQKSAAPDKPFFLYYATGSAHAPLHAPADWIARFKGRFDKGWDAVRAETVARQRRQGIITADGREIGRGRIARTISKLPEMTDTLAIGFDADTSVTGDYADGGRFTGRISKVDIEVGKPGAAGQAR